MSEVVEKNFISMDNNFTCSDTMDKKQFMELYERKLTDKDIALELGITRAGIAYWRKRYNLPALPLKDRCSSDIPILSAENKAYIAGLLDGEGCFSISKSKNVFRVAVTFYNTNRDIIQWLQEIFPTNSFYVRHDPRIEHKDGLEFVWFRIVDVKALLEQIQSYLIVKKNQCKILIEFCDLRLNCEPGNATYTEKEDILYEKNLELNRRGKIVR